MWKWLSYLQFFGGREGILNRQANKACTLQGRTMQSERKKYQKIKHMNATHQYIKDRCLQQKCRQGSNTAAAADSKQTLQTCEFPSLSPKASVSFSFISWILACKHKILSGLHKQHPLATHQQLSFDLTSWIAEPPFSLLPMTEQIQVVVHKESKVHVTMTCVKVYLPSKA
jgi:hypothetical protein